MRKLLLLLLPVLLAGCSERQIVRIGAKNFAEQQILAEIVSGVLKDDGYAVEAVVECGDTYACYAALRAGKVDLLVNYTGTGFVFRGESAAEDHDALARLNALYEPRGLTWLYRLGFDNGYILAMRGDAARSEDLGSISDLAAGGREVTLTCPQEFLRRPLDGLQSLISRYGLRMRGEPLVKDRPADRVLAVLDGRADAAVLYGTDGAALDSRILALEDDLAFFPAYEAALVVRSQSLQRFAGLEKSLCRLSDRVTRGTMRQLNRSVQLGGASPAAAAADFLAAAGLLVNPERSVAQSPELVVAVDDADNLAAFEGRVLAAVHKAWPQRRVVVRKVGDPLSETLDGGARMALLGAERFFASGLLEDRVEAVVALGSRRLHMLCREGVDAVTGPHIGVPQAGAGGDIAADAALVAMERVAAWAAPPELLLDKVAAGELDCALFLAENGAPQVSEALAQGALRLVDLPVDLVALRQHAPYLRPARVQALAAASDVHEAPDPVLPSAWERSLSQRTGGRSSGGTMDAVLNGLALLFMGWLVFLVFRREERT